MTRRRGAELEEALLEAAWRELVEVGYGRFTIDGVAGRAGTSRPVIYRRWPDRAELAIAAVHHYGRTHEVPTPDTGTLRGDLLAILNYVSTERAELAALFSVHMGEYYAETGRSLAQLREDFLEARQQPFGMEEILRRGIERGEIDPDRLTPRIAGLPGDLIRHDLLTNLQPPSEKTIIEIVDDIFLPLVTPAS
ncbi:MAG TPA: TetR/AcrR family transcriptional regulator [Actinoplanes sp.]|jgi:AcrR family transcriptional regulator